MSSDKFHCTNGHCLTDCALSSIDYDRSFPPGFCPHSGIKVCWEKCETTEKKPTLFDHLAQSPEEMAAKLVYRDGEHKLTFTVVVRGKEQRMGHECWRSTIIPGDCWAEYDRAYAATIEKLKDVYTE